jgi:hypothetical protein
LKRRFNGRAIFAGVDSVAEARRWWGTQEIATAEGCYHLALVCLWLPSLLISFIPQTANPILRQKTKERGGRIWGIRISPPQGREDRKSECCESG